MTVIFDLDGTLIDSSPSILGTFQRVLDKHGLQPQVPLTSALIGPPLTQVMRTLSGRDDEALLKDFKQIYDAKGYLDTARYPGVDDLLSGLSGRKLFIATNKRRTPTEKILAHFGWDRHFTRVACIDTFPVTGKTEMIARLMAEQRIGSGIYVGDRAEDRDAAVANGLSFVAAAWGYDAWPEDTAPLARTPAELLTFLAAAGS